MRHPLAATLLVSALCILWPSLSFAQVEEVRIAVDGLTCNLCAAGLERSLRTLDSVASVQVSLQDESAVVKMKTTQTAVRPSIVSLTGTAAQSITRRANATPSSAAAMMKVATCDALSIFSP